MIGVTRNYGEVEIDKPVRDASMSLMRSVPRGKCVNYVTMWIDNCHFEIYNI